LNIVECFSHLNGFPQLEKLIAETLRCVNTSFKYNTIERYSIYNLKNIEFKGCTTFYLFPLLNYLFSHSPFKAKNERLFFLVANYIQILDDYIDIFDDIDLKIKTPITIRFYEIESSFIYREKNAFDILTNEVQYILLSYLNAIKTETLLINKNINDELFKEWNLFNTRFQAIHFPLNSNITEQKKYLKTIHGIIPPIICYIG
jgi:hypothetical protein